MAATTFHLYQKTAYTQARVLTEQDYLERNGIIETLEGPSSFQPGDYLCEGIKGEQWPQPRAHFEANHVLIGSGDLPGFALYRSTSVRAAAKMSKEFTVTLPTGTQLKGKAGDYLVKLDNEMWVVDSQIFEETYRRVDE